MFYLTASDQVGAVEAQNMAIARFPRLAKETAAYLAATGVSLASLEPEWRGLVSEYAQKIKNPDIIASAIAISQESNPRLNYAQAIVQAVGEVLDFTPPQPKSSGLMQPASMAASWQTKTTEQLAAPANTTVPPPALTANQTNVKFNLDDADILAVFAANASGESPLEQAVMTARAFWENQLTVTRSPIEPKLWAYVYDTLAKDPMALPAAKAWLAKNPSFDNPSKVPARVPVSASLASLQGFGRVAIRIAIAVGLIVLLVHIFKK
jgi:hypothetical protein